MCGVSAVYQLQAAWSGAPPIAIAEQIANRMRHRGPDDHGVWSSDDGTVAFGHRRLSVVDLSAAGHQPMTSNDGRWTLAYNGELYNTDELALRVGVDRSRLRGHSDTEVLIEAIARVGLRRTLEVAIGMFAFALFDRDRDAMWLARDRFGEKPLFFAASTALVAVASELSALTAVAGFDDTIDADSLATFLERSAIPAPFTIYRGVRSVLPGEAICFSRDGTMSSHRYYDPSRIALDTKPVERSDEAAIEEFESLLASSVAGQLVADVPLGAFLSGGVDSTMVVAMMQSLNPTRTVQTYTIGFEDDDLDEAAVARTIASTLGTQHHEWVVTGADALAVVPQLGALYDQPFADPSQIPTVLVSRFAHRSVTVALTGDGGDELFGGYERYQIVDRLARYRRAPKPLRAAAARTLLLPSEDAYDRLGSSFLGAALPQPLRKRTGKRAHTAAQMLGASDALELYDLVVRPHRIGHQLVPSAHPRPAWPQLVQLAAMSPFEMAMAIDTADYLPNDILTKVDRASMSTSLETRAPMLDPRLHAWAWSLTTNQRVRDGAGKWVVREAARRHVPAIADLPKRGFGVPLSDWLRGSLRIWADDLLSALPSSTDLLDHGAVRRLWADHTEQVRDNSAELWPILMFGAWAMS